MTRWDPEDRRRGIPSDHMGVSMDYPTPQTRNQYSFLPLRPGDGLVRLTVHPDTMHRRRPAKNPRHLDIRQCSQNMRCVEIFTIPIQKANRRILVSLLRLRGYRSVDIETTVNCTRGIEKKPTYHINQVETSTTTHLPGTGLISFFPKFNLFHLNPDA